MQKALSRLFSLFGKPNPLRKRNGRKSMGQSLVEVAVAFPVLIMLFSGVVEFGFIINYYLSLVDATRDAARFGSPGDPFDTTLFDVTHGADTYYFEVAVRARTILDPSYDAATNSFNPSVKGRRISLDPAVDDVIVSVYSASGATVTQRRTGGPYHLFPTQGSASGNYPSIFVTSDVVNTRISGAPNAGLLLVEVHYNYHHVLGLPWMTAWLPNPLHLQAYTIMPLRSAEPVVP